MKYITVKLTEQQLWELKSQVHDEIRRLEGLLLERTYDTFRDEIAFQKRLITALSKAEISEFVIK